MQVEPNTKINRLTDSLPLLFGCAGLLLCAIYQSQRSRLLVHSLSRFVKIHLDAFAGGASLAGLVGILGGLFVRRINASNKLVVYGIGAPLVSLVWSIFGLSL